jgi:hypothetical protein
MSFLSENLSVFIFVLMLSILGIIFLFSKKYQTIKTNETKKLELLTIEFESEKKIAHLLAHKLMELERLENSNQQKLLQIKLDILNIDFTLKEIF